MPAGSPAVISTGSLFHPGFLQQDFDVGLITHLPQHAVDFLVGTLLHDQVARFGAQRFSVRSALRSPSSMTRCQPSPVWNGWLTSPGSRLSQTA